MNISKCNVQEVFKEKIETGDIKDRKKSRRPTHFIKSDCKYIKPISSRNRTKSYKELGSGLAQTSGI